MSYSMKLKVKDGVVSAKPNKSVPDGDYTITGNETPEFSTIGIKAVVEGRHESAHATIYHPSGGPKPN